MVNFRGGRTLLDRQQDVFDTMDEALAAGALGFSLEPFLVRQLCQAAKEVSIPALPDDRPLSTAWK